MDTTSFSRGCRWGFVALVSLTTQVAATAANGWTRVGPEGGSFCRLAAAPGEPQRLYAGPEYLGGGVFRSADGGETWQLATFGLPATATVCALAVDPGDSDRVVAGVRAAVLGADDDLYLTTNAGESWDAIPAPPSAGPVVDLLVLRESHNVAPTILVASATQVWRSDDDGGTWSAATGLPQGSPYTLHRLTADPFSRRQVFVGVQNGGAYVSSDGGRTWNARNRGLRRPLGSVVEIIADTSQRNRLWARTSEGFSWQLYRSSDSGRTWRPTRNGFGPNTVLASVAPTGGDQMVGITNDGSYHAIYSRDGGASWRRWRKAPPAIGQLLVVDSELVGRAAGNLYRSRNHGASWQPSALGVRAGNVSSLVVHPTQPANVVLVGSSGVARTTNAGATWTSLLPLPEGAAATAPIVSIRKRPNRLAVGLTTSSTSQLAGVAVSLDHGESWQGNFDMFCRGLFDLDVSWYMPPTLVRSSSPGNPRFCAPPTCVLERSLDDGKTWQCADTGLPKTTLSIVFSPLDGKIFSFAHYGLLAVTYDNGDNWFTVNTDLANGSTVLQLVPDPHDPSRLHALTAEGLLRSDDVGVSFTATTPLPTSEPAKAVVADRGRYGHLFVATAAGVYETFDAGDTWHDRSDGLTEVALGTIQTLAFGAASPAAPDGILYAGTLGSGLLARTLPRQEPH